MGAKHSKNSDSTINWNNIDTDNISSTVPNLSGLSNEAKQLIANLNIPEISDTQSSISVNNILDNLSTNLNQNDKQKFNQILSQMQVNQPLKAINEQDMSDTSPFISSEMYNYLVSATSENGKQKGGAKKQKKITSKKGGKGHDDDLEDDTDSDNETSSTSDADSVMSKSSNSSKSSDKKKKDKKKKEETDTEQTGSGDELSYISSSAHTGGELSDTGVKLNNNFEPSSSTQSSTDSSSASTITDEKRDMMTTSMSVNTDDINMVSEY
jgi:hypothetical protein